MNGHDYLLSFGSQGEFGRFRSEAPLALRRGDRAVVRTHRGLELATVLRPADAGLAQFLPNTATGVLLRPASADDQRKDEQQRALSRELAQRAESLACSLALPLEVLDAEVLLDGEHAILHILRGDDLDPRPLVSELSRAFAVQIQLADLPIDEPISEAEHGGCTTCGSESGGCGSCGSEGGGCGSCKSAPPEEVTAHFAALREQFERRHALL